MQLLSQFLTMDARQMRVLAVRIRESHPLIRTPVRGLASKLVEAMMADQQQEWFWVLRAQSGDREALEALLRAVQAPLYRCLVGIVDDAKFAEDLLQEVLFRIYRKLPWLRDPRLFRPWCHRIATREAYRQLRRQRRQPLLIHDEAALDALTAPVDLALPELDIPVELPALLHRVSPASRLVLVLHYQNFLSLEEVADTLAVPLGTVKSRLAYGLKVLRKALANNGSHRPGE